MRRSRKWFWGPLLVLLMGATWPGCIRRADYPSPPPQSGAPVEDPTDIKLLRALSNAGVAPARRPPPEGSRALVELGQALMFDPILSGNHDISCATCHNPDLGTGDGLSLSVGTKGTGRGKERKPGPGRQYISRNAPPLFNLSFHETLFWDGRLDGENSKGMSILGAQASIPLTCRAEMLGVAGDLTSEGRVNEVAGEGLSDEGRLDRLAQRVEAEPRYEKLLPAAFPESRNSELKFSQLAEAIAAFERDAYLSFHSPFDAYVEGDDKALNAQQKRGALLFYGRAKCSGCHRGILLTDERFHNVGVPQIGVGRDGHRPLDLGRGEVTGKPEDRFRFRTPSLRNVAETGPWMHDGAYTSLTEVVEHYKDPAEALKLYAGTDLKADLRALIHTKEQIEQGGLKTLDPIVRQSLTLNPGEVEDLVAFLHSLSDPKFMRQPE